MTTSRMSRRSNRLQARNPKLEPHGESVRSVLRFKKRKAEGSVEADEDCTKVKKQQFEIQSCWPPLITGGVSPCILIETPHKEMGITTDLSGFTQYRFKNLFITPSPLPTLSWGSSNDVWRKMVNKETKYIHDKNCLLLHPTLKPNMRAILLDWLLEVCEVYTLHRDTFYLAQDFFDRFMLTQNDIHKNMLQLIGISSLFIAAKLEEIYPPKLQEFAYVTDGACSEEDILTMELIILKALKWELCPVSVISWLNLYLQVDSLKEYPKVLQPQYSQEKFIQIAQLLDLCILEIDSLHFPYRILAAAALFHFTSTDVVRKATGLEWNCISECVHFMEPFYNIVKGVPVKVKTFKKVAAEDRHNIQTHTNYLDMLDELYVKPNCVVVGRQSPLCIGGILTPPKSTEKTLHTKH
ncbi:G1/S-specific cyclin-E2 isoform X2 [Ambystoma mexicanum]|uniref:Cyclin E2 n=2 Tax=Ambystoma TaxID=8295 RepID=A0A873A969_AMBME|nr:cyclin E2 [Ambystoma mexicanum]QOY46795.1 cyclin E2 [Ambystoma velasci]